MADKYRNYAFISYSHRDMAVAKWLQKRLEGFRLPTEIHNDIEAGSKYLRPIFRDQSDLNTGILGDELRKHLEASKYLILICSRHSAQSEWVSSEARAFVEMGRLGHIIPVIIPDRSTPEPELFPAYLRDYFQIHPDKELLGIDMTKSGREKALVRVVSRMLDVKFDSLWKRHQRRHRARLFGGAAAAIAALATLYFLAVPVDINIAIEMQKASLPSGGNVKLTVEGGEYEAKVKSPSLDMISVPGYKRFSKVHVTAQSEFYIPIDTMISTGLGLSRNMKLKMNRDSSFATYGGTVYDPEMEPIEGVTVTVAGHHTVSDSRGAFSISLPLEEQRITLPIKLSKRGFRTSEREDESPGDSLIFILHKGNGNE